MEFSGRASEEYYRFRSTQPTLTPINHEQTDFYAYLKNEGTKGVHTKGTNPNPVRALIFRDSFFSSLEPFVSPLFSEAEYHWKQFRAENKAYVLEYKPDIIMGISKNCNF